jgi:hypothetical protein
MPAWVLDLAASDVAFQQASGNVDALEWSEQRIRGALANMGANVTFALDEVTGADQWQVASDGGNLADWPDEVHIFAFAEGSVLFLDGGELNLGIVRDSTLNNTNDAEFFAESFEALAHVGVAWSPRHLTLTTCPNGESQIPTDETGALCSGS